MTGGGAGLRFEADAGTGLPRLLDPRHCLSADVFRSLEEEMRRRFEELVGSKPDRVFHLPTGHGEARAYHVVVRRARGQRCPTLELIPADGSGPPPTVSNGVSQPPAPAPASALSWWQLFDQELERLRQQEDAGPLTFVIADLRAIMADKPDRLLPLLLAGYLRLGDAVCRKHGDDGRNDYTRCALVVQRQFAHLLPAGALDDLMDGTAPHS